jgi:hypothetical protein
MAFWARWWPLTGLAFVGLWIGTLAATDNDVDTHDSDAKIVAYVTLMVRREAAAPAA